MNPVDDLGYNFSLSPTRQSRHDHRTSVEMPPSYLESDPAPPPEYTQKDEPVTLAMYLFKFGFREFSSPSSILQFLIAFACSVPAVLDNGRVHPVFAPPRAVVVTLGRVASRQDRC